MLPEGYAGEARSLRRHLDNTMTSGSKAAPRSHASPAMLGQDDQASDFKLADLMNQQNAGARGGETPRTLTRIEPGISHGSVPASAPAGQVQDHDGLLRLGLAMFNRGPDANTSESRQATHLSRRRDS